MASSGSSRRPMLESRSLDLGSDELLLSYDDYTQQKDQTVTAKRSEPLAKDLHENRIGRPLGNVYGQQEEIPREDILSTVEICMKKHTDNLMRNLEEISGRLTQLELFCYKLERSVGEFRTDMIHGQSEADIKLKSVERHLHEVQRSLQIIRDKQELADAHNELAKLQLSQKETVNSTLSQRNNEDVAVAATSEAKPQAGNTDMSNLQLALALPNQISSSHAIKTPDQNLPHTELPALNAPLHDRYIQNQPSTYYTPRQRPPLPPSPPQELHYTSQGAQIQNLSLQSPPPPFTPYQQQWPQSVLPQQPSSQTQVSRPQISLSYSSYNTPYQPSPVDSFPSNSIPMPTPYSASQSIGYGGISHLPLQHNMQLPASQGSFVKNVRIGANPYPPQPSMQGYNPVFPIDGNRASHPQSYQTNISLPASPLMRNHSYGEMVEKAVGMGYLRDHVVSVVSLMGEKGQAFDFNALLDELNNGGPPRAWSR